MVATAKLSIQVKNINAIKSVLRRGRDWFSQAAKRQKRFIYHYGRGQGATALLQLYIVWVFDITPRDQRKELSLFVFCWNSWHMRSSFNNCLTYHFIAYLVEFSWTLFCHIIAITTCNLYYALQEFGKYH